MAIHIKHNEKRKLVANNLDRASTAALTLGVLGPLAAAFFQAPGLNRLLAFRNLRVHMACTSVVLHLEAKRALDALREPD